jgi:hypothetical protein
MNLTLVKDIASIAGGMIALCTLIKSVVEYTKRGAQERAAQFESLRLRFKSDVQFRHICDLLETDDPELRKVPFKDKRDYLGFFEEIALMMNTGLMKENVGHVAYELGRVRYISVIRANSLRDPTFAGVAAPVGVVHHGRQVSIQHVFRL